MVLFLCMPAQFLSGNLPVKGYFCCFFGIYHLNWLFCVRKQLSGGKLCIKKNTSPTIIYAKYAQIIAGNSAISNFSLLTNKETLKKCFRIYQALCLFLFLQQTDGMCRYPQAGLQQSRGCF